MAARSIWNGTITFGMVNVPIKLYTATESFHLVHARDGARIENRRICSKEDKEVPTRRWWSIWWPYGSWTARWP